MNIQIYPYQGFISNHSLTHWRRVTHNCIGKLIMIGSDNGLAPGRHQPIIWTNAGMLLRNKLHWNFNRNSNIFIQENALEDVVYEMASNLSWPQCVKSVMRPSVGWCNKNSGILWIYSHEARAMPCKLDAKMRRFFTGCAHDSLC